MEYEVDDDDVSPREEKTEETRGGAIRRNLDPTTFFSRP